MQPEKLYLVDIVEAAEAIQRFIAPVTEESFLKDELRQSGVLQKLIVIGEASGKLSKEFQNDHPELEWAEMIGFRNIAVHEYFAIMWEIVWETAVTDVPKLNRKIKKILSEEFDF